jgi:hypothetical protein
MGSTKKNPKSPSAHLRMLCFFSLTGGLIKFFYDWLFRILAMGIESP